MFWLASVVHGLMTAPLLTVGILVVIGVGLYVIGLSNRRS
jgi:hypothetical protein